MNSIFSGDLNIQM